MSLHPLGTLGHAITSLISSWGYWGVLALMTFESACIPIPSEVILPFSGFLVLQGRFQLWPVAWVATAGCVLGSVLAYGVGILGGRPAAERYGRWILLSPRDLARGERWFQRQGSLTVLVSRVLPVVRTFISLPAGIARMPLGRFLLYTAAGSLPWCWALAWAGLKLGEHWPSLATYFHRFDLLIAAALAVLLGLWVYKHLHERHDGLASR